MIKKKTEVISLHLNHILDIAPRDEKQATYGKINLVQIGRLETYPGCVIQKHTHLNWFELTCVVEGEGDVYAKDVKVPVKKGDIFLSFPCEAHRIDSSLEKALVYDHFAFYTKDEVYAERLETLMANYSSPKKRVFKSYFVREMLDGSIKELLGKADFQREYLEASFALILIELFKIFEVKKSTSFMSADTCHKPDTLCKTIQNYIDTHLFSINNLNEIASLCGYNYSYLSFLFKKNTGITLSDYFKAKRFESAKLMISENKLKIGEISNLLGYNSVYAFSKAFKDEFGVSPKNYYKSNLQENK